MISVRFCTKPKAYLSKGSMRHSNIKSILNSTLNMKNIKKTRILWTLTFLKKRVRNSKIIFKPKPKSVKRIRRTVRELSMRLKITSDKRRI